MQKNDCLFCRISNKSLPADILWEDEHVIVFKDIHPRAKVHYLIVPKHHIDSLAAAEADDSELLGQLLYAVNVSAKKLDIHESGYRTIINTGPHGDPAIDHLHLHILGGEPIGPMRA